MSKHHYVLCEACPLEKENETLRTRLAIAGWAPTPNIDAVAMKAGSFDQNALVVSANIASRLESELEILYHFATCPYDHCERCCSDEKIVMAIRDRYDP